MLAVSAQIAQTAAARPLDGQGWRQAGELALAVVLSASIGLEREIRQKNAGLRTHTLGGVGAALVSGNHGKSVRLPSCHYK